MNVTCEKCGRGYDDVYRLTYCPHDKFGMMTTIMRPDGSTGIATTLAQADRMLKGERS